MSAYVNGRASGLTPAMHQSSVNIRPRALRKKILRSFKLHGLHLRTDAVNALSSVLCQEEDVDASLEAVLSSLSKKLQRLGGRGASSQGHRVHGGVVDLGIIEEIVAELTKDSEDRLREALTVVSAYDHPRLCFDPVKKSFYFYDDRQSSRKGEANAASPGSAARFTRPGANSPGKSTFASRPFHGSAQDKVEMFRERFMLVRQRVRRNEHFSKSSSGSAGARAKQGGGAETASIELTPIDSLLGAKGTLVLLGMLTQREDGKYHLEDLNGSIPVNLSRARITKGLFTLGCIVVMEGAINEVNGEFIVETMGFPPPESREQALSVMSSIDLSRITGFSCAGQEEVELKRLEMEAEEAMFVVLSDVHLDSPKVMHKLRLMFEGFSAVCAPDPETGEPMGMPPSVFIFFGNFSSQPFGKDASDVAEYKKNFDALADLILEFPQLTEGGSKFLFIPGPTDPGAKVLPRGPIPRYFTSKLRNALGAKKVRSEDGSEWKTIPSSVSFSTNPCRLRYFTQEIVLFRDDVLNRMRRSCIVPPALDEPFDEENPEDEIEEDDDGDVTGRVAGAASRASVVTEHLVKTVLDQGHLSPLPLTSLPVRWAHDCSLRLYPLPDLLLMADHYDSYHSVYNGTVALNPGSFPTDFSFVVYRPFNRKCEFSKIG